MTNSITVIGTGYVGLVSAACLARLGNQVVAFDIDARKIDLLEANEIPIHEPQLKEVIAQAKALKTLRFTSSQEDAFSASTIFLVAVGTPARPDGSANTDIVHSVVADIIERAAENSVIMIKSTVPPGTARELEKILQMAGRGDISVVSNPEFLREGRAIFDFNNPDKIVIGGSDVSAMNRISALYAGIDRQSEITIRTDSTSAELAKYAANAMLATRISFMNEVSNVAKASGAQIVDIKRILGMDPRIGPYFLNSGIGYGGSCFPKDVQALRSHAHSLNIETRILEAVHTVNEERPQLAFDLLREEFPSMAGKKIAIWGVAFKPHTDDIREAPAIKLIRLLLKEGASVVCFDPVVSESQIRGEIPAGGLVIADSAEACIESSDALVLTTEWPEFVQFDVRQIHDRLAKPFVVDCRQVINIEAAAAAGIKLVTLAG